MAAPPQNTTRLSLSDLQAAQAADLALWAVLVGEPCTLNARCYRVLKTPKRVRVLLAPLSPQRWLAVSALSGKALGELESRLGGAGSLPSGASRTGLPLLRPPRGGRKTEAYQRYLQALSAPVGAARPQTMAILLQEVPKLSRQSPRARLAQELLAACAQAYWTVVAGVDPLIYSLTLGDEDLAQEARLRAFDLVPRLDLEVSAAIAYLRQGLRIKRPRSLSDYPPEALQPPQRFRSAEERLALHQELDERLQELEQTNAGPRGLDRKRLLRACRSSDGLDRGHTEQQLEARAVSRFRRAHRSRK